MMMIIIILVIIIILRRSNQSCVHAFMCVCVHRTCM